MIPLALFLSGTLLTLPPEGTELSACTNHFYLEARTQTNGTFMIGPLTPDRSIHEAQRTTILLEGWLLPRITPDPEEDDLLTPANFLMLGIRKLCCKLDGPPQNWWCRRL